jgi:hypothetical protein
MNLPLFGATRIVGQGDSGVQLVKSVGRTATGIQHAKVREVVHKNMYYYIFASSRAATILRSPALWGRVVACGRLSIGQMPLTSRTPRLRLAAMRNYSSIKMNYQVSMPASSVSALHRRG